MKIALAVLVVLAAISLVELQVAPVAFRFPDLCAYDQLYSTISTKMTPKGKTDLDKAVNILRQRVGTALAPRVIQLGKQLDNSSLFQSLISTSGVPAADLALISDCFSDAVCHTSDGQTQHPFPSCAAQNEIVPKIQAWPQRAQLTYLSVYQNIVDQLFSVYGVEYAKIVAEEQALLGQLQVSENRQVFDAMNAYLTPRNATYGISANQTCFPLPQSAPVCLNI